ncbi:MAG TPA: nucleotidyl transferase AbiEii/AbiGii toxin family protein [Candidatus Omnitrophota bacterium]|nr:nucleotidyl transferase AbiEii/AbiGii toxin family protein [Candidatus Omnitrophota bacterium]HPS19974.1 nucleotidyl transferase AbiEii/AbiGii toxin family protein [Candidatus Omnitrophota bacterium]
MYYESVFKAFNKNKIQYLVAGGLAVNLHGVPRMTPDLDVLVAADDVNLKKIVTVLTSLKYTNRLPGNAEHLADREKREAWIKNRNLTAYTFYNKKEPFMEVDILLVSPVSFEEAYKRRVVKKGRGISIPIVSMEDLITMKWEVKRETDLDDIRMLKMLIYHRDRNDKKDSKRRK